MWKWGSPPKNSGVGRREANWIYYFSMFCGKAKRYESLNSRAKFSHEIFILAHLPWYSIWQSSTVKPNRYFPRQVASLSSSFDNRKHPTGGFDDNRHTKPAMNKFLLFFSLWRGGKDESLERKMPKNKEKYFNLGEFTRRETINWIDFCDFSKENRRGDEKCHTNHWQDGTTEFSTFLSSFFSPLIFFLPKLWSSTLRTKTLLFKKLYLNFMTWKRGWKDANNEYYIIEKEKLRGGITRIEGAQRQWRLMEKFGEYVKFVAVERVSHNVGEERDFSSSFLVWFLPKRDPTIRREKKAIANFSSGNICYLNTQYKRHPLLSPHNMKIYLVLPCIWTCFAFAAHTKCRRRRLVCVERRGEKAELYKRFDWLPCFCRQT